MTCSSSNRPVMYARHRGETSGRPWRDVRPNCLQQAASPTCARTKNGKAFPKPADALVAPLHCVIYHHWYCRYPRVTFLLISMSKDQHVFRSRFEQCLIAQLDMSPTLPNAGFYVLKPKATCLARGSTNPCSGRLTSWPSLGILNLCHTNFVSLRNSI